MKWKPANQGYAAIVAHVPQQFVADCFLARTADQNDLRAMIRREAIGDRGEIFDRPLLHLVPGGGVYADQSSAPQRRQQINQRR